MVLAVGLMSGTSLDGVDAALLETDGEISRAVGKGICCPYSTAEQMLLRDAIGFASACSQPDISNDLISSAGKLVADKHVFAINKLLEENNVNKEQINIIGFHGQTINHRPDLGWTWQIGDAQHLANETGLVVMAGLRQQDMAKGGQGAPLAPIYHWALARAADCSFPVAVVNIGGVGNVTWMGSHDASEIMAFDTGPGNAMLNDWVKQHTGAEFDKDGLIAEKGQVDQICVDEWLKHDYFHQQPPKSLDRDDFADFMAMERFKALSLEDGAATLVALTVETIATAARYFPKAPGQWFISGGGAQNPYLMRCLADRLSGQVQPVEAMGGKSEFMEAEAFAYLAVRAMQGKAITYPGTTGAPTALTGGHLYQPQL